MTNKNIKTCCDNCKDKPEIKSFETESTNNNNSSAIKELFSNKEFKLIIIALLIVIPFEALSIMKYHFPLWFEIPFFLGIIGLFGKTVIIDGIKSIFKLKFSSINLLMTIAIIGAIYLREFEEAAIIVLLFSLGEKLEEYGFEKSKNSIAELVKNKPKTALIKGEKEKVAIETVKVNDIVIVKQGEQIPLDGVIISGKAFIDETAITGEPLPKDKTVGDMVFAATINTNSYLEIKVTKIASETTYAKILEMTEKALENKSNSEQFIEKFAKYYTPTILVGFLLMIIIPVFFLKMSFNIWFERALTLLVISCPCALVISTPITIFSAMGNASKKGVMIKGGKYVEELGKIKVIAFDKTRTLTTGELQVTDIIPFNGYSEKEVIECVAGMELYSEHPLAKSIVTKANNENLLMHSFKNLEFVQGKGIKGDCMVCTDKQHVIGNLKFISQNYKIPNDVLNELERLEKEGKTVIISCDHKKVKGLIALSDTIKEESKQIINSITNMGITPIILSGDSEAAVKHTAKQLGVREYKFGLLPENKVETISLLTEKYKNVAMVGDGVNDTPALAKSSVGIAMGAAGSDSAIETADIVILNDNIKGVEHLLKLGKKTMGKIRFNIALAIGIKILIMIAAILGYTNLALAIFADVGVTVIVIINGLSIFNYEIENTLVKI